MVPVVHKLQGRLSYGAPTAPGLKLDGERLYGSRRIMRRLDEIVADPPLYPSEEPLAATVVEAERWGDEILQPLARRLSWAVLKRSPRHMEGYSEGARLPVPISLARPSLPLLARAAARLNGVSDEVTRSDLQQLPALLDRVDGWIADGVLGGEHPNAADLQIGSSLRLLASLGDLRPQLADRPAARLTGYFPPLAGSTPSGVLPGAWVPAPA
jgi:glutathione S-transferase